MSNTKQIAVTTVDGVAILFALQEDGTIWQLHHAKGFHETKWGQVQAVPESAQAGPASGNRATSESARF